MTKTNSTAILLLSCKDRTGLISRISHVVFERNGNILNLDEHVDVDDKRFFIRIAWDMRDFLVPET
jgi:formyltetrahydrofolate deformylase